jgi:putative hydrolase of the HAD superfamily
MCRLAVISNFSADLNLVLEQLGLLSSFELIVNSAFAGVKKPDTKIYELACNQLGVEPGDSVFIDDVPANVCAARSNGMKGIVFSSAAMLREELCAVGLALRYL